MNDKLTAVVTGCGGDIGQSIIKILKELEVVGKVLGCDIHDKHPGHFLCDEFVIVPRIDSSDYESAFRDLLIKYDVDLLIPTSEPELRAHCKSDVYNKIIDKLQKVKLVIPNSKALEIGFDKFLTSDFLRKNDFPYLETKIAEDFQNPVFPCILKDRYGAGSKSVFLVKDKEEYDFYLSKIENLIYQEYVAEGKGEFTCGLYREEGDVRVIIFRRILSDGGYSGYGEVWVDEDVNRTMISIAKKLSLNGSINVQFRLKNGIPYIFEINPRFSSTVLFRHLLGFSDLQWTIEKVLNIKGEDYFPPNTGSKFYKGFQEFVVN